MKTNIIVISLVTLCLLLLALVVNLLKEKTIDPKKEVIYINDNKLYVEIAKSSLEKAKGLSGRKTLGQNEGMLFVYQSLTMPSFWMKEMFFPIDIVWIRNGKVIEVSKNISSKNLPLPETISPKEQINMVLEVNAGVADDLEIHPGNEVSF